MKPRLFALAFILSLTACVHGVAPDTVLPAASDVAAIEIVLPSAPHFSMEQRKIAPVVLFLRQNCPWVSAEGGRQGSKEAGGRGYTIMLRLNSGRQQSVQVEGKELLSGAYRSRLSAHAVEMLDDLCGVETVRLSPLHAAANK